jgi:heat shock protein HtpX
MLTLMLLAGRRSGMTIALVIAFVMSFFTDWFSGKTVLRMYAVREFTEAQTPGRVQQASLHMMKVYIIGQNQPNTFATGKNLQKVAIAVNTGILRLLSGEEPEGLAY